MISLQGQDVVITNITTTPVTCGGGSDGTITVTITGGDGFYTYLLVRAGFPVENVGPIPSQTFTFTGHDRFASYIIIVSDQDDDTSDDVAFVGIDGPDVISITSYMATDITCNGANDGTITVAAAGEQGNFVFDLTGPVNQSNTSGFFSGLPQGDYTVLVSDQDGCPSTDITPLLTINNPTIVSIALDNVTNLLCFGDNTGSIAITPSGGTPAGMGSGYTYDWTGPAGFTSSLEDITNLEAGDYSVTVYDENLCSANAGPFNITQPPEITVVLNNSIDVTCNGGNDGSAQITAGGGAGGFTYTWEGQVTGFIYTDEDPTNLVADIYDLTLSDANGCSKTYNSFVTIDEPLPFSILVDGTTNVSCSGGNDGSANISPGGGTPPYTFSWSGATSGYTSTDEDPVNMPADEYSLVITDSRGCNQLFSSLFTITEPTPLIFILDGSSDVSCFGGNDGAANVTVSGGVSPYSFSWTGDGSGHSSAMEDPNDLVADTYDLVVTDNNGCILNFNDLVIISEPAELAVTVDDITDVDCNGAATGVINITPSGGTPVYAFSWTGPNGFTATTEDILNLEAGDYSLTLSDANGCSTVFSNVATIAENSPITATFNITDVTCNGGSDGALNPKISGGKTSYSYSWTGPSGFTSSQKNISGLIAGDYQLTVTDDLGCVQVMPVQTLNQPPAISATASQVDIDCFGADNGSIDLTPSGGTPPYTFAWTGPGGFTASTEDLSGLETGAYSVTVTDANLCSETFTDIVTLLGPAEIQVSSVKTDISCGGLTDGAIDITVTGGTLPYTYAWSGPSGYTSTLEDISGLAAGSYSLTITDGKGCVVSFPDQETIIDPTPLVASYISHEDVLCYGDANGSIQIDVTGGTAPFSFDWTNGSGITISTDEDPTGLLADTYSLTVIDVNGCFATYPDLVTLHTPEIVVDNLTVTDVTGCNGDATGSVVVAGSGGTGAFTFSLDGGAYQASGTFNGLLAGSHTLTLKDVNDCTLDTLFSIAEPSVIAILTEQFTDITCSGANDGIIQIAASGGTAPLNFTLNPGAVSNGTGVFNGLMPGTYTVSVSDAAGCGPVDSSPFSITDPPALIIDSLLYDNISCNGAGDGSISIYVSGGVRPYEYSFDNQGSWSADSLSTGLTPATYEIYIRDANVCTVYGGSIVMTDPPLLSLSVTTTDITSCSGDTTGAIDAVGSGGTGNLEYSLDGLVYQPTGAFNNLSAGPYTVTLRDEAGCSVTEPVTLNEPDPVMATITKTDAIYGNLGSILITESTGGTPPYQYTIGGDTGTFTGDTFYSDLEAATYHVIIRDLNSCTYDTMVDILDVPPLDVIVNITHVSCFGEVDGTIEFVPQDAEGWVEYSIDSGMNYVSTALFENLPGNSTYYLIARDEMGKVFTGVTTLTEPTEILLNQNITPAWCNAFSETGAIDITVSGGSGAYSFLWSDGSVEEDRSNIVAGIYTLETRDSNNCTRNDTFNVNSFLIVEANAGEDTTICYGESIQLNGLGGHTPAWDPSPFIVDTTIANPITNGITESTTFVLTITEETSPYGCYNRDSITVTLFPLTGIEATEDTIMFSGSSIQLEATGGPFSDYRWEPTTGLDNSTTPDPLATLFESIRYYVYGTNEFGCEEVDSLFIEVIEDLTVYNVFSPNGDGVNDYFEIKNSESFPDILVEVYSRWGDQFYSSVGYNSGSRWDGTARGKDAPVGSYYYVIIPYSGAKPITGTVTIIR
ncbi:MAG: gliding motility-associated C-terminal domain-containing protein [Bacteroidota bacterium]